MQVFAALANETRLEMIKLLLEKDQPVCICELDALIDKDTSVLYRNIKQLERAGLVTTEKDGRKLFATLTNETAIQNILAEANKLNTPMEVPL